MKKLLVLALAVFVAASILFMAHFVSAQSYPKPAAPQFSQPDFDIATSVYNNTISNGFSVSNGTRIFSYRHNNFVTCNYLISIPCSEKVSSERGASSKK